MTHQHHRFPLLPLLKRPATLLVLLVIFATTFLSIAQSRQIPTKKPEILTQPRKFKFQLEIKNGCDYISYPNATINDCGFCVGGGTGLEADYGKDCKGVCFGQSALDCHGVCDGNAFVDECTGLCVQPGDAAAAWSSTGGSNRDCRGLCAQPTADLNGAAPMPSHAYTLDPQCGLCRMASSFSGPNSPGGPQSSSSSPSGIDCNGACQLPGLNRSTILCGQCVRPSELDHVLDDCGNCISEGHPCSCDRDPTKCGCIDPNNCYLIKSLSPGAIPSQTQANVTIVGYFYPYAKQLFCVARRNGFEAVESFPVHFLHKNKTVAQCTIQLAQVGEYVLGLGFRKNVFITPPKDLLHLYVFSLQSVNISLIGPAKSLTNESDSLLTIDFEDLTHDIPPIPIRCKVHYESGESELSNFGIKPNSCTLRPSSLRAKSQRLKIYPTFDGVYLFPTHMEHLIEATPPRIFVLSSFVSEDGLSVVVNFDKPVDLVAIERNITANTDDDDDDDNSFMMCDYLLKERTMEHLALHNLQSCRWATRIQLIITIQKPLSTDAIEVELNPQTVQEFDQRYPLLNGEQTMSANISKLSNSLNWWSYEPAVVVVGPNQVAPCDQFVLIGLFTSPRGTHEVDFSWEVAVGVEGGTEEATDAISNELRHYVSRHGKSTNLILSADMVEVGVQYRFTFKAFIQARRQTIEAAHTLTKLEYPAPMITLYHTRLLHNMPLYESDNITLLADVRVPECVYPPQRLVPSWRVTDPKFHFPLTDMKRRFALSYTIEPYTVPPNHPTSITLNAFIGLFQNQSSSATYHFETVRSPLKADLLNGINKMTIGSQSGLLRLTSGGGGDKQVRRRRVVHQWSCHDVKTAQPCYFNYASVPPVNGHNYNRNSLLITPQMQHHSELFIESTSFLPNQQYLIGLQVFDANNSKVSSETEYTLLNVEAGAKPQVSIGPVLIKGKYVVPYNNRFSTFLIPFGTSIAIRGQVYLQSGVKSVRWESTSFRYPLNWSKKRINEQQIDTELRIHDDSLMAYGVYTFKLIGCSELNQCSSTEISLMAAQSATMCNVIVDSYVELELSTVNVEKCNLAPSSSPVTYQVYLEDENFPTLLPVNAPQLSPVILFAGPPAFGGTKLPRIAIRVCDRFDTCSLHFSQTVSVENSANLTAAVDGLVARARRLHRTGDPVTALSVTNAIFLKPDVLNESYRSYEAAINATIEFATDTLQIPSLMLTAGHYEVILNGLSFSLLKTNNFTLRRKLLALIVRFYDKAEAMQTMPSINSVRIAYSNVMNAFVLTDEQRAANMSMSGPSAAAYLKDIRTTFAKLKKAAASQLPLGSRLVLVAERIVPVNGDNSNSNNNNRDSSNSEGLPPSVRVLHSAITEITHLSNAFDVDLRGRLSANQTVSARVQFGEEVRTNLSNSWDCGQALPCSSVVYSVTLFPGESPFPANERTHRLSPVLDITIHAPRTGREQVISGLLKAAVFELTVTGNESYGGVDYATKCHYFDEAEERWRMDDLHPLGIAYQQAGCWSGHLSTFVVLRTGLGLNTDYIIGVLVACVMGVLVFGMMVVFYIQRKNSNMNVNEGASEPPTPEVSKTAAQKSLSNGLSGGPVGGGPPFHARIRPLPVETEIQTQTILVD